MFLQTLVHETDAVLVTYLAEAGITRPVTVGDRAVLERRSPVVWFTFPGARHDIGRFHTPAGRFTGYYANILTPVEVLRAAGDTDIWRTTDLFLDVFMAPDGAAQLLDEDELREAVRRGWIHDDTARVAEEEARRILTRARDGDWPPPIVEEWTLRKARAAAHDSGPA